MIKPGGLMFHIKQDIGGRTILIASSIILMPLVPILLMMLINI